MNDVLGRVRRVNGNTWTPPPPYGDNNGKLPAIGIERQLWPDVCTRAPGKRVLSIKLEEGLNVLLYLWGWLEFPYQLIVDLSINCPVWSICPGMFRGICTMTMQFFYSMQCNWPWFGCNLCHCQKSSGKMLHVDWPDNNTNEEWKLTREEMQQQNLQSRPLSRPCRLITSSTLVLFCDSFIHYPIFPIILVEQLLLIFRICLCLPHVWSFLGSSTDHINIFIRGQRWPLPVRIHAIVAVQLKRTSSAGAETWTKDGILCSLRFIDDDMDILLVQCSYANPEGNIERMSFCQLD